MTDKTKHHLFSYLFIILAILLMFLIMILVVYFTRNSGTQTVKKLLQERFSKRKRERALGHQRSV